MNNLYLGIWDSWSKDKKHLFIYLPRRTCTVIY